MLGEEFIAWSEMLIAELGYLAILIVSFIGTSTILIPFPIYFIIFFAAGLGLNPLLVGLIAGIGSATGELTGYLMGMGGEKLVTRKMLAKRKRLSNFVLYFTGLFKRYGFLVIVATSFLPFPFDFIGVLSGMSNYNIKKFYLAVLIGKTLKCLAIAYAGYFTIPFVTGWD